VGGTALTGASKDHNATATSPRARSPSISSLSSSDGDEAAARGRQKPKRNTSGLSGVSAVSQNDDTEEARDTFDDALAPPPTFASEAAGAVRKGSPNRDSKFQELL